jgi:hypothetical protein
MAQTNRSAPEASASPPAEVPVVQNGPPFASLAEAAPSAAAPFRFETPPPSQLDALPAPSTVEAPAAFTGALPPATLSEHPVPRPAPDLDPMPVTAADFEDEPGPGLLASLGSTRPTKPWLGVGLVALGVAFGFGLFVGRGTQAEQASRVVASEPARPPATTAPLPAPERTANAVAQAPAAPSSAAGADTSRPATTTVPVSALTDVSKSAPPSRAPSAFDSKLANTSIASAAARVKGCKDVKVPPGSASVVVTFATTGRVVAAAVTTPAYSTGRVGGCIVSKLKTAQVPPFTGAPETVKKTINLR